MARIKVTNQSFDMVIAEVEALFNRTLTSDDPPTPRKDRYTILPQLSPNRQRVINQCKVALVRQFGTKEAARYIRYREGSDARGYQYWLKYQIERSPYPDDYCLLVAAQKWFDGAEVK